MTYRFNASPEDQAQMRAWLEHWEEQIHALDFATARQGFDEGIASFGTHADIVIGLDQLENGQWRKVWPTIDEFRWRTEQLRSGVSSDRLLGFSIIPWSSIGFHADGTAYDRLGRATILFSRGKATESWRAIHTHISLNPGTPAPSHGNKAAKP